MYIIPLQPGSIVPDIQHITRNPFVTAQVDWNAVEWRPGFYPPFLGAKKLIPHGVDLFQWNNDFFRVRYWVPHQKTGGVCEVSTSQEGRWIHRFFLCRPCSSNGIISPSRGEKIFGTTTRKFVYIYIYVIIILIFWISPCSTAKTCLPFFMFHCHAILPERVEVASSGSASIAGYQSPGYYPIIAHSDSPWSGKPLCIRKKWDRSQKWHHDLDRSPTQ